MNTSNIFKFWLDKPVKSQRSKDIEKAVLKFIKAVEDATTFKEMRNLRPSYKNLSKALLSDSSDKELTKFIIHQLHFMCLLKIKSIQQTK